MGGKRATVETYAHQWANAKPKSLAGALNKMRDYSRTLEGVRNDPELSARMNALIESLQELIKSLQKAEIESDAAKKQAEEEAKMRAEKEAAKKSAEDSEADKKRAERVRCAGLRPQGMGFAAVHRTDAPLFADAQVHATLESELQRVLSAELPREAHVAQVNSCLAEMEGIVDSHFLTKNWRVAAFGSAVTGYGTQDSDLDVVVYEFGNDERPQQSKSILQKMASILGNSQQFVVNKRNLILQARVPILKLLYNGTLEVDLSVNNTQPLLNTRLLKAYASLEKRVAQLGVVVKLWAKINSICGAKEGHLSSYAFILMSIYFLQVSDAKLPCLQQGGALDNVFEDDDTAAIRASEEKAGGWTLDEDLPLSTLVCKFFAFYAREFRWGFEVVSVRLGRRPFVSCRDARLHIEDPFVRSRDLCDVLKHEKQLKDSFAAGDRSLQEGRFSEVLGSGISNGPARAPRDRAAPGRPPVLTNGQTVVIKRSSDGAVDVEQGHPGTVPPHANFMPFVEYDPKQTLADALNSFFTTVINERPETVPPTWDDVMPCS